MEKNGQREYFKEEKQTDAAQDHLDGKCAKPSEPASAGFGRFAKIP